MCEDRFEVLKTVATSGLANWILGGANPAVEGYRRAGANWLPLFCFSFAVFVVAFVCVLLLLLSLSFLVSVFCVGAAYYL